MILPLRWNQASLLHISAGCIDLRAWQWHCKLFTVPGSKKLLSCRCPIAKRYKNLSALDNSHTQSIDTDYCEWFSHTTLCDKSPFAFRMEQIVAGAKSGLRSAEASKRVEWNHKNTNRYKWNILHNNIQKSIHSLLDLPC